MNQYNQITIESSFSLAKKVEKQIIEDAMKYGYCKQSLFALRLCLEEALTNAIRHGNNNITEKKVSIDYRITNLQIDIKISDEGKGFIPDAVSDPTSEAKIDLPSGRGLLLMRSYMDDVTFNEKGNMIHLVKTNLNPEASQYHTIITFANLDIKISGDISQTTITLSGSIEMIEAQELDNLFEKTTQEGCINLIVDLSDLLFTCSTGLGALIKAQTYCKDQKGLLVLVAPHPSIQRVLQTTRLETLFTITPTLDDATTQLNSKPS